MTKTSPAPFKPSWFRKTFGYGLIGIGCFSILVLDRTDIVMNATHSLHEPAFLMVDTPILLTRGSVVASEMPEVLKETFGEFTFVKRIGGLPGDEITLDESGNPCIQEVCFPPFLKDGKPVGALIEAGFIPEGHYALFGTEPDSLDSRYQAIGFVPHEKLVGRGWALPMMPDWREAKSR